MKKLLILDVSSYIFRAYHAVPPLTNSRGEQVNAIYGFINMYLRLVKRFGEFRVIAALDSREKTKRKEMYPEYKANRKEVDPELRCQFPLIMPMLKALSIPYIEMPGYEADDIIATLVRMNEDSEVFIVSSDKDLMQLVDKKVFLYDSMKDKVVDSEAVLEKFGVQPSMMRDLLAIMGDSSDNVPGLPGIGPKTGSKFLQSFKSIEGIYDNLSSLTAKQREKFEDFRDQLFLSRELVSLQDSLGLDSTEPVEWKGVDEELFIPFATEQNFKTILKNLGLEEGSSLFGEVSSMKEGKINLTKSGDFFIHKEEENLYISDGSHYAACGIEDIPEGSVLYGFDVKSIIRSPYPKNVSVVDLQIAYFITDSGRHGYSMDDVAKHLAIHEGEISTDTVFPVLITIKDHLFSKRLDEKKLKLLHDIEMPNLEAIGAMEQAGIGIDIDLLLDIRDEFAEKVKSLEEEIYAYAGETFNINSPKQIAPILFEKLGLPVLKKTKTGASTGHEVLQKLMDMNLHPLPGLIIEHRKYTKLISTYLDPIEKMTTEDERLHTTFIATHAATGRLASREPNLQNIPVRTEEGRRIRSLFRARDGYKLVSIDYSQIELRILGELSKDPELVDAFLKGEDIHRKTASAIFHVFPELVDDTMRSHAKAVNFGIIYGMQAFKLSQDTGVALSFAKEYIKQYFNFYKEVRKFIDSTVESAKKMGYVETLFGRRRYIPEIKHKNKNIAGSGERMAVNTRIQGTAADVIKMATGNLYGKIETEDMDARILLQVHDELIFEVAENQVEKLVEIFTNVMEKIVPDFSVSLRVNASVGDRWSELK